MRRLLLVGAGHAHAQVLLDWAAAPCPGVDLVVVSPHALAPYSGMLPGWLAGVYAEHDIVIDFAALCRRAGARWLAAGIDAIDTQRQRVHLDDATWLDFDILSLNIGSTLTLPQGAYSAHMLALRPLAQLRAAYAQVLQQWTQDPDQRPWQVSAVGGGAAGFEVLLAVLHRLRRLRPERPVHGTLLTRSAQLLPGYPQAARRHALRALDASHVTLQTHTAWSDALGQRSDLVLWATGAQSHAWLRNPERRSDLALSDTGFILIDAQLRALKHPHILAVGDCAQWARPLPKAGVYAVRMGPVLAHNLRAMLNGGALQTYTPQNQFLSLLTLADGRAIASRAGWSLAGRWAWRWKDHIDRQFIARFATPAAHTDQTTGEPT